MKEKDVETMNNGRMAQIALDAFTPFMEQERDNAISKLKQAFRDGEIDAKVYLGSVSILCSLEDIENRLKSSINKSRRVI